MSPFRPYVAIAVAALLVAGFSSAAAAKNLVTSVSAKAVPDKYSGDCPAALEFVGTIKVSKFPVTVEYLWERSNRSRTQVRRIQVRSAVQKITDEWSVGGAPGAPLKVWEKLTILSPSNVSSALAKASVSCK
jgi:hypothetical protein